MNYINKIYNAIISIHNILLNLLTPSINYTTQSGIMDEVESFVTEGVPHILKDVFLGLISGADYPTIPISTSKPPTMSSLLTTVGKFDGTPLRNNTATVTRTDKQHFKSHKPETILDIAKIKTSVFHGYEASGYTALPIWNVGDPAGKPLFFMKVGPLSGVVDWYGHLPEFTPSALDYISVPFKNWSGSIEYEIEIFASQGYHRGALRVAFHPGIFDPSNLSSVSDNSSQYFADINLAQGKTKYTIRIPFVAVYNYLLVCNSNNTASAEEMKNYFTGLLLVTVAKKLNAPPSVEQFVRFTIRTGAGDDFKLYNTTNHNQSITLAQNSHESIPFITQSDLGEPESTLVQDFVADENLGGTILSDDIQHSVASVNEVLLDMSSARSNHIMPENTWSLKDTMGKIIQFDNVEWASTAPAGTILRAYNVPSDISKCEIQNIAKKRFTFSRQSEILINAHVSGSPFQSGCVAAVFLPLVDKANLGTPGPLGFLKSATNVDFAQKILMQPFSDDTHTMSIPFRTPQEYLKEGDNLGVFVIMVYAKLSSINQSEPVNIMLSSTFQDAEVYVPTPCTPAPTVGMRTFREFTTQSVMSKVSSSAPTKSATSNVAPGGSLGTSTKSVMFPKTPKIPSMLLDDVITLGKTSNDLLKTKDAFSAASVPHAEDTNNDMLSYFKKFSSSRCIPIRLDSSEAYTSVISFDILNDLVFHAAGTGSLSAQGSGTGVWFASLMRAFRGDIRIKIKLQAQDQKEVYDLHVVATVDTIKQGPVGTGTNKLFLASASNLFENDPGHGTTRNSNMAVGIISNAHQEILAVEAPFTTLGGFIIIPTYTLHNYEPYSSGYLNLAFRSDNNATKDYILSIYTSIGDTASLGIPFQIPSIKLGTYGMYPDRYIQPSLLRDTEYPDSDSSIEMIEVPKRASSRRKQTII
jgi:hypothetical protein